MKSSIVYIFITCCIIAIASVTSYHLEEIEKPKAVINDEKSLAFGAVDLSDTEPEVTVNDGQLILYKPDGGKIQQELFKLHVGYSILTTVWYKGEIISNQIVYDGDEYNNKIGGTWGTKEINDSVRAAQLNFADSILDRHIRMITPTPVIQNSINEILQEGYRTPEP